MVPVALRLTLADGEHVLLTDANDEQVLVTVHRTSDEVQLSIRFEPECTQRRRQVVLRHGEHHVIRMPDGEKVKIEVEFRDWPDPEDGTVLKALALRISAPKSVAIFRGELVPYQVGRFLDNEARPVVQ